jgi:hypothetical protein
MNCFFKYTSSDCLKGGRTDLIVFFSMILLFWYSIGLVFIKWIFSLWKVAWTIYVMDQSLVQITALEAYSVLKSD